MIWKVLRWFFFRLDPELAHALGGIYLRWRGVMTQGRVPTRRRRGQWELGGQLLDSPLGIAAGFDKHIVEDVIRMINKNEYKRRQAPVGVHRAPDA